MLEWGQIFEKGGVEEKLDRELFGEEASEKSSRGFGKHVAWSGVARTSSLCLSLIHI